MDLKNEPIKGRLQIIAKYLAEGFLVGLHRSPFHGFSVEFAEHKAYDIGDNLKYIDWKVYAQTEKMFVKKYQEETNLRCCFAIDVSSSMAFPNQDYNKLTFSCVLTATIMHLLAKQQDAFSIATFSDQLKNMTATHSGKKHYGDEMVFLEKLMQSTLSPNSSTNLGSSINEIAQQLHRRSLVIICSDGAESSDGLAQLFASLERLRFDKHEVIFFNVLDESKENSFQFENRPYEFVDMEDGSIVKLNPEDVRESYIHAVYERYNRLKNKCLSLNIDFVDADINQPINQLLLTYLIKRNKMM